MKGSLRLRHICFTLLIVVSGNLLAGLGTQVPPELNRYTLMRDRILLERYLHRDADHSFFLDLNVHMTSGLKTLIGDLKTATDDSKNAVEKQLAVNTVLSGNLNTGHMLDIDLGLGFPLPSFTLFKQKFLPGVRGGINVGASFATYIPTGSIMPTVQLYFKMETKYGLHSFLPHNKRWSSEFFLYKMSRQDLQQSVTGSALAGDDEQLISTDKLSNKIETYDIDWHTKYSDKKTTIVMSIEELRLKDDTPELANAYGYSPLMRVVFKRKIQDYYIWELMAGAQYRDRYSIGDGLFAGVDISMDGRPLSILTTVDGGFLTLSPKFKWKFIKLLYTLKIPVKNGHDGIWMPNIHAFSFKMYF